MVSPDHNELRFTLVKQSRFCIEIYPNAHICITPKWKHVFSGYPFDAGMIINPYHLIHLIPNPVANGHRLLVKALPWIHSAPNVSCSRSRCDCEVSMIQPTSHICKHRFSAIPIDKTSSVEVQAVLVWSRFCPSIHRMWD